MMMNKCFSHRSCDHNNYEQQQKNVHDQKKNIGSSSISRRRMFKCDLCHRIFTSGSALGGHKSHHKHDVLDDHRKQKHACHHYDKSIEWQNTSSLEQHSDDDQFQVGAEPSTIDLSKYLPPRSHKTKKRSSIKRRRNMIDHELVNAATILFHMSRCVHHAHTPKRLKLSSNAADNDYIEKQASGDETPATMEKEINNNSEKSLVLRFKIQLDIEEKKKNNEVGCETGRAQSHNELKSKRSVRNFDLNELPMEDVTDE